MQQLQARNPQMFQMINQARNSGANPRDFMQQMMKDGNISSEQMQNVLTQGRNMGIPPEILNQVQNMNK